MSHETATRPAKDKHGMKSFKKAISGLRRAGLTTSANRFEEALAQRRRLMKQLRKLDPENPVLAELEALDTLTA